MRRRVFYQPEVGLPPGFVPPSASLTPKTLQQELTDELREYIYRTAVSAPPGRKRWVMSAEWCDEVCNLAGYRGLVYEWETGVYLLGIPIEIRDDAGVPDLELLAAP